MKKLHLIATIVLLAGAVLCYAQVKKTVVKIKDIGTGQFPDGQADKHKHHEAEFFKRGNSYMVTYYQSEHDTLRYHSAIPASADVMTQAEYYWDKDTIVVRLFNDVTKKEKKFKAFGHRGSSSIKVD